ncbi:hypothetical protein MKZ38_007771 [Zalerion maritima]|uniref:Methylglutaconyl-CoA hydratase n=1 Tax=Zalerion maritima TaxID=339359 RepID=A0AAD5RVG5_9PEZI|nr:hypothetical protein MKZ38_007771 [Zalerion maritima]
MASRPTTKAVFKLITYRPLHPYNGSPRALLTSHSRPYSSSFTNNNINNSQPIIIRSDIPAPHTGHIRILELNRPSARNAISRALLSSLAHEITDIATQYDPSSGAEVPKPPKFGGAAGPNKRGHTRALVLASAVDESFCAGADLKERKSMSQEETADFLSNLRGTLAALEGLQIPTISAISSMALGGGLEVALATTFRVLASTATVGLPETRLGIIPGAGGTYRLPALIGVGRARDLVLTGRRVGAAEAYFIGIADRLVEVLPEEDERTAVMGDKEQGKVLLGQARKAALSEAVRLAQEICEGGPVAIRAGLKAVSYARPEVEDQMYQRVVNSEDKHEALAAFREKRKPVFKGR